MTTSTKKVLQAATTIAKTTPTTIKAEIDVSEYNEISFFVIYSKGDETGVNFYVYTQSEAGGTVYQDNTLKDSSGTLSNTFNKVTLLATTTLRIDFDVSETNYVIAKQGGSNNDGTPTGTLAVDYTLTR